MSNKSKGSNAERELYQMFVNNHYRAVRVAGSGVMENADCDLIAGKPGKKYAIECKSSKKPVKYITKEQIESFVIFSEIFGLEPVIALRFNREGWFFLKIDDLKQTEKSFMADIGLSKDKGISFERLIGFY